MKAEAKTTADQVLQRRSKPRQYSAATCKSSAQHLGDKIAVVVHEQQLVTLTL